MASKVQSPHVRPTRPVRFPYQLVLMCDARMDAVVREYADTTGQPIASALRELVAKGLDSRRRGWRTEPIEPPAA